MSQSPVHELIYKLDAQKDELRVASSRIAEAELALLDRRQKAGQLTDSLQASESGIAQTVLANPDFKNESARQNAIKRALAESVSHQELAREHRAAVHALAVEAQHVNQLKEQRSNIELHGRNLRAAAELLAASLHDLAQTKRQTASQQFLQGVK